MVWVLQVPLVTSSNQPVGGFGHHGAGSAQSSNLVQSRDLIAQANTLCNPVYFPGSSVQSCAIVQVPLCNPVHFSGSCVQSCSLSRFLCAILCNCSGSCVQSSPPSFQSSAPSSSLTSAFRSSMHSGELSKNHSHHLSRHHHLCNCTLVNCHKDHNHLPSRHHHSGLGWCRASCWDPVFRSSIRSQTGEEWIRSVLQSAFNQHQSTSINENVKK